MNREKLITVGVNYDEGVDRFGGINELYEKYLLKFFEEKVIEKIETQLNKNNFAAAANSVHSLKGESGNLSLTKIYDKTCILMELLRNNSHPDKNAAMDLFYEIKALFENAKLAVGE